MTPITVVAGGDVFVADRLIVGNQGLVIYLVNDRVLFVPTADGQAIREWVGSGKVAKIVVDGGFSWLR